MNTKLYVGNLAFNSTEDDLTQLFSEFGTVTDVFIVKDKFSGRSKGFAFVTFETAESMNAAIEALNETEFAGRPIKVNEARPKEENSRGRDRSKFSGNRDNSFKKDRY